MTVAELEAQLRSLLKGEYSSLSIRFNDHAANYEDAEDYYALIGSEDDISDWISTEERQKAIDTNSVWEIQWYPQTPVGFCRIKASSLAACIGGLTK
ncbi:hypothetical protein [Mesorhizobium sp.]|uniref:hypothetical protein n=1 Tax=Mesorhizobium sp. TaxID=1871066 RepID=UPI000FE654DF|nr:hypothetical protein [Mesorhizobium sp.]RWE37426.1 MAG: hypothetical protein EOS77_02280 [Mesorhizobium sp.]